jgi:putative Mg2+ transporter-C (MgtC) family protein
VVSALLGGLVGLEREYNDQPAGFRTHLLVTLGAALFTIAGAYGPGIIGASDNIRFDPTRVAAQVVTGIGFLGAGAILRQGINIRGLTTAASIWTTAAIGVAIGLGYWAAALLATAVAIVSLITLRPVERALISRTRTGIRKLVVDIDPGTMVGEVAAVLERRDVGVRNLKVVGEHGAPRQIVALVSVTDEHDLDRLAEVVAELDGVSAVDFSR